MIYVIGAAHQLSAQVKALRLAEEAPLSYSRGYVPANVLGPMPRCPIVLTRPRQRAWTAANQRGR
jgi:hypothetical protein